MFGMPDALVILGVLGTVAVGFTKMPIRTNGKYVTTDACEIRQTSIGRTLDSIDKRLERIENRLFTRES